MRQMHLINLLASITPYFFLRVVETQQNFFFNLNEVKPHPMSFTCWIGGWKL